LFFAGVKFSLTLFVTGFLLTVGAVFGRYICGFVCPFGLFQDLLYKIKSPKLRFTFRRLRYLKYVILGLFVIVLPCIITHELTGLGSPWFCKYICPAGTIFGAAPLLFANEFLRSMLGWQFVLKTAIAVVVTVGSVFVFRLFCRLLCPLGALYALFNKVALVKMRCDKEKCTDCGRCAKVCLVGINPVENVNSGECVRCRGCAGSCSSNAKR
jgi:polyferredoxin